MTGPCACRNPRRNFPTPGKDKLAGAVPTKSSATPTPTPVVLPAPSPAPATALTTTPSSDKELFKQFIKAYLQDQMPVQIEVDSEPYKQLFKARFSDFYYSN